MQMEREGIFIITEYDRKIFWGQKNNANWKAKTC